MEKPKTTRKQVERYFKQQNGNVFLSAQFQA